MKTAIIFSGNIITTELVANMIKNGVNHDVDIFDTSKTFYIDFSEYDNFVLGTNVRYGKLNKRFVRCVKKMKKYVLPTQNYFVYICGIQFEKAQNYIKKAKKLINNGCEYYFVGGELKTDGSKGLHKILIQSIISDYNKNQKKLPTLIDDNINKLINSINEISKE